VWVTYARSAAIISVEKLVPVIGLGLREGHRPTGCSGLDGPQSDDALQHLLDSAPRCSLAAVLRLASALSDVAGT
jgi:hypothetical protein